MLHSVPKIYRIFYRSFFKGLLLLGVITFRRAALLFRFNRKVSNKRYFQVAITFGRPVIIGILQY